jgi:hypothetical protein
MCESLGTSMVPFIDEVTEKMRMEMSTTEDDEIRTSPTIRVYFPIRRDISIQQSVITVLMLFSSFWFFCWLHPSLSFFTSDTQWNQVCLTFCQVQFFFII